MRILNVLQGSEEWKEARAKHFCASEAPAMMGASSYTSRTELLRQKATGDVPEVDAMKQSLFDRGHAAEDAAREHLEAELGDDLFPTTATDDEGYLLASFDGITMDGETGFEHKLWNEELAAQVLAGELPPMYYWQLEQQALIAGIKRVIFVCSDGTPEKWECLDYYPVPGRAQQLLAGWQQFAEDLKAYQHVEVLPAATAKPTLGLPALSIQVTGSIALVDNLKVFGERLGEFIDGLDKNPSDDQAFANTEAAIKTLQTAQDALEAAESSALAQTSSIDEMRRTVALYADQARTTRLMLQKLVTSRKESIRVEIVMAARAALASHINGLNKRLGKPYMPAIPENFAGVIKGKKTIASLRDACDTELASVKIESNAVADRIDANIKVLAEWDDGEYGDYGFLFSDANVILLKACDDFATLCKSRVSDHKAKEEKRVAEERERIRREELAKIEAKRIADEKKEADRIAAADGPYVPPVVYDPMRGLIDSRTGESAKPAVTIVKGSVRPTDDAIVTVLAQHYRVHESRVITWIMEMDLDAVSNRLIA